MSRGNYKDSTKGGTSVGWKPLLVLGGIAGALYWLKNRQPTTPSAEDELTAIAHQKGFADVAEYERAVLSIARAQQDAGAHVRLGEHLAHLEPAIAR